MGVCFRSVLISTTTSPNTNNNYSTIIRPFAGMGGFYRGIDANIMRAMVLNGTKMGVYDHCKGLITKSGYIPSGTFFSS